MKKIVISFLAILLVVTLCACSESHPKKNEHAESPQSTQVEKVEDFDAIDIFIEKYNDISDIDISDTSEINITEKDGGHYRTEFRTAAFKDAEAKTGKIESSSIDIISYGSLSLDGLRIYVDASSFDEMKQIFKDAAIAFDQSITEDDLHVVLSGIDTSGGSLTIGNLTGTYETLHDVYSFMLDDSQYIKHLEDQ